MENATYIALSRLDTEQRAMSIVANNIANASTNGFKAQHILFSDYLSRQNGAQAPDGETNLQYNQDLATFRDIGQGQFEQTGNPLDIAIGGDGYFTVKTANGNRLTRSGRFVRAMDGSVTDEASNPLLDRNGQPIRIPRQDQTVTIASDGTISTENGVIGQIGIVVPQDNNKLQVEGGKLLVANTQTRQDPQPKLVQGMVESSNVQLMSEVTQMMQIQRNFEFMSEFVQNEATRQQNAISRIVQASS
ncbi:flagellar basal-body rod protein FlgF [Brytella acorum]|uniref:Flagellar basal-body rod protein FlgF n=1 Tax=Brytella acorum TaxID=2959299 RepID=A0AA35UL89_9PROT|nr:flagellar basal-body rod protein FlgF [Brytella acorum]MDF3625632.1 flagellar basal-body rod protein FlgF [Brytella acorum]CAI9119497.1 flagellar basal-body rod protein FlgF [Brytella acorum]